MNDNEYYAYRRLLEAGHKLSNEYISKGTIEQVSDLTKNNFISEIGCFLSAIGCQEAAAYVHILEEPNYDE